MGVTTVLPLLVACGSPADSDADSLPGVCAFTADFLTVHGDNEPIKTLELTPEGCRIGVRIDQMSSAIVVMVDAEYAAKQATYAGVDLPSSGFFATAYSGHEYILAVGDCYLTAILHLEQAAEEQLLTAVVEAIGAEEVGCTL